MTNIDKNEDRIAFAEKSEDQSAHVPSLVLLEDNDKKERQDPPSARNYINTADDKVSEFQEPRASIRTRVSSLMASSKKSSQDKNRFGEQK